MTSTMLRRFGLCLAAGFAARTGTGEQEPARLRSGTGRDRLVFILHCAVSGRSRGGVVLSAADAGQRSPLRASTVFERSRTSAGVRLYGIFVSSMSSSMLIARRSEPSGVDEQISSRRAGSPARGCGSVAKGNMKASLRRNPTSGRLCGRGRAQQMYFHVLSPLER